MPENTYDEVGRDPRYATRPTLVGGSVVIRDDEGHPILTDEQNDYVARITRLVARSYARREAIGAPRPTVAMGDPIRPVCDELRDIDVTSPAPDPITGTRSTVRTGRTRAGKQTSRVTAHGIRHAPVTDAPSGLAGERFAPGEHGTSDITLAATTDAFLRLHRDVTAVSPVTGRTYRPDDVPVALLGSVVRAFQYQTPRVSPVRPARVRRVTTVERKRRRRVNGATVTTVDTVERTVTVLAWNGSPVPADETYGVHGDACGVARSAVDLVGWYDVPDTYLTGDRVGSHGSDTDDDGSRERGTRESVLVWGIRESNIEPRKAELDMPRTVTFDDEVWHTLTHLVGYEDHRYVSTGGAWHRDGCVYVPHPIHGERAPVLVELRTRYAPDVVDRGEGLWIGHGARQYRPAPARTTTTTRKARTARAERTRDELRREALTIPPWLITAIGTVLATGDGGTVTTPIGTLTVGETGATGRVRLTHVVDTDPSHVTGKPRTVKWQARANAERIAARIMRPTR